MYAKQIVKHTKIAYAIGMVDTGMMLYAKQNVSCCKLVYTVLFAKQKSNPMQFLCLYRYSQHEFASLGNLTMVAGPWPSVFTDGA